MLNTENFITVDGDKIPLSIFRSKKRRKTIAFKFNRDGSLQVLAPFSASLRSLQKIFEKRSSWIKKERAALDSRDRRMLFADGSFFPYLGYSCRLDVSRGKERTRCCKLHPHRFCVHVPDDALSAEGLREEVRFEILLWIKKRAREKFQKRLDLWSSRFRVDYKKFVLTNPKRRWGSCSVDNVIRLNWRLMLVPLSVLDYVVAHELCHIRHKNHSERFWAALAEAMPDYKARRKLLRRIEKDLDL